MDGIYGYRHYHSTAHDVLRVVSGNARVQFVGPEGETLEVHVGDVVVRPAGVGHCIKGSSSNYRVVGGYADGRQWDVNTGKEGERPRAMQNIHNVPVPNVGPVYGSMGPLTKVWEKSIYYPV